MNQKNLAFIDIETTGLDPEIQEIIEIGGVVVTPGYLERKYVWKIFLK